MHKSLKATQEVRLPIPLSEGSNNFDINIFERYLPNLSKKLPPFGNLSPHSSRAFPFLSVSSPNIDHIVIKAEFRSKCFII